MKIITYFSSENTDYFQILKEMHILVFEIKLEKDFTEEEFVIYIYIVLNLIGYRSWIVCIENFMKPFPGI